MTKIRFRINFETKVKRKFEEFLDGFQQKTAYDFHDLKIEKYWKIENQYQANFILKLENQKKEQIVFEILKFANCLYPTKDGTWIINGPYENENKTINFECILNNMNLQQSLKWASIEIEE